MTAKNRELYKLKREFGRPIDLYRLNSVTNNVQTGIKSITKTKYPIKRGIILPDSYIKSKVYSLSFIAANKNFTYGGLFNRNIKAVIIDHNDLPSGFEILPEDFINIGQKRFCLKDIDFMDNIGWLLVIEHVDGNPPEAVYEISIFDDIRFTQGVSCAIE